MIKRFVVFGFLTFVVGCSNPQPGPDKTIAGTVLGAGWGAGTGAVIGHQVRHTQNGAGLGAGIGAGFGAVAGAMSGGAYDLTESTQIRLENQLASLKIQNMANAKQLDTLQDQLDYAATSEVAGGVYQVFFDVDATSLRAGSVANLEVIAESIKRSAHAYAIHVVGHTDDTGDPKYNDRLSEARARAVSAYLGSRGISMDQIHVTNHGAKRPIASNVTDVGRQLNRRVDVYISSKK